MPSSTSNTTREISAAVVAMYPQATRFGVASKDQTVGVGYTLIDVGFDDTTITHDSGTFAAFADDLDNELGDLPWGSFGDADRTSSFDVDIKTGQIIR
jgi:hypothetical protein